EDSALGVVELTEARIEPGRERIRLQEPQAETVDRRDPRGVELAGEVRAAALRERGPDARAQLAGPAPRVRDHEDRVDVETAIAYGADEPLDKHGRLAGARTRGHEDLSRRLDGRPLLLVHGRAILQIVQRSHQCGQSPPFGSCFTSPSRIRPATARAVPRARSTAAQSASSSR